MALIPTSQKRPFIPAQGVAQLEMIYTYLGQKCENVYHVLQGDGATAPTIAELNAIAAAGESWEHTDGVNARNNQCTLTLIRARDLTTQSGTVVERVPTTTVTGVGGGVPLPGNVTAAVKWSTALGGRSFRGRTYHIGLEGDYVTGNQLTAGTRAILHSIYANLLTQLNAVPGVTMVVVSYSHNKFWRASAVMTPITQVSVDPNTDSQRRRLTGRGQ